MRSYSLGIDFGTGGAKACIIDEKADALSYAFREYPIITSKPGWSEHDPCLYWKVACEIIKECIDKAAINPRDIKGIGTSSALPSMVLVDKQGNPIQLAYNLMDRRAIKEVEWLKVNIGEKRIFEVTANRLEDHPSIVNLMWERNHRSETFKNIYKALTIDGFIRFKLTGKATVNYSNAAFYGVYNIKEQRFDEKLLREIGVDIKLFPEIYACEEIIGEVTENAAKETSLVAGIVVSAGQADACAGWVGAGAMEEGDIQMNLSTCGVIGVIHKNTNFLRSMISCAYTVDSKNNYVTISCTTTGGQLIRYIRDNFSYLELAMENLIDGINAYDFINMEAEKVKLGCDGLVVLPYLMGERTPLWDAHARGVIFGLSLNHTKGHIIRAMMESVAYALYDSFSLVKEKIKKINYPIVLNEGGAKSKLWRRIITDVFNIPTVLVESRIGAPFGDAILGGVSAGMFKDYTIAKQKAKFIDPMEPVKENHERYMEYFKIYKNLYEHLKQDFKDLYVLRNKN